jgi:formylglycine-generating enzyme required for sulfatase activity
MKKVAYNNNKSKWFCTNTTVNRIAGYDGEGKATYFSVGANDSVWGWVSHATYAGFIYTDLFSELNATGGNTTPVGSYEAGKSANGCYDMAGNVWNWCDTMIVATNARRRERGSTRSAAAPGTRRATVADASPSARGEPLQELTTPGDSAL